MSRHFTRGTCSRMIDVELDGNVVKSVKFYGGCDGNLKAISAIAKGKTVEELASVWEGNTCGGKPTSCADQLIKALKEELNDEGKPVEE